MTGPDKTRRILAAARDLFLLHGLRGTSMEAIARAAGVAKPTLYARYPDKEAVFRAIGLEVLAGYRADFTAALAQPGTPAERLIGAIAAKYGAIDRLLGTSPHAADIMSEQMRVNAEGFEALHRWVIDQVAAVLAESGQPDATERARLILAAIDGVKAEFGSSADLARLTPFLVQRLAGQVG